jgi:hypothetical protein
MLYLTKPDLKVLMQHQNPKFEQLSPDLNVQLDRMSMGCCLCRLLGDDDIFTQDVLIPVWKAAVSVMILVAKKDHEYALFTCQMYLGHLDIDWGSWENKALTLPCLSWRVVAFVYVQGVCVPSLPCVLPWHAVRRLGLWVRVWHS